MKIKMPNGDNFAYIGPFGMAEYMKNCCDSFKNNGRLIEDEGNTTFNVPNGATVYHTISLGGSVNITIDK